MDGCSRVASRLLVVYVFLAARCNLVRRHLGTRKVFGPVCVALGGLGRSADTAGAASVGR